MTSLINKRNRAYESQGGACYYCGLPMWLDDEADVLVEYLGLKIRHVPWLRCTAEHLVAKIDGGTDAAENIAAACHFCNSRRHRQRQGHAPSAASYRARVAQCMAQGHWHPAQSRLGGWGTETPPAVRAFLSSGTQSIPDTLFLDHPCSRT